MNKKYFCCNRVGRSLVQPRKRPNYMYLADLPEKNEMDELVLLDIKEIKIPLTYFYSRKYLDI